MRRIFSGIGRVVGAALGVAVGLAVPALAQPAVGAEQLLAEPEVAPSWARELEAAASASQHLVVWEHRSDDLPVGIRAARVGADGTLLDPAGIGVAPQGSYPSVASDGDGWLVVWSHDSAVLGARVDAGGNVLDPTPIEIAGAPTRRSSVAWSGTEYLVAYGSGDYEEADIWARRVAADGTPSGAAFRVGGAAGRQEEPVVAGTSTQWLVAWRDDEATDNPAIAARVAWDGTVLDPSGITVATAVASPIRNDSLVAASDGSDVLLGWEGGGGTYDVRTIRIAPDGTVVAGSLRAFGGPLGTIHDTPAVAWGDGSWLVGVISATLSTREASVRAMDASGMVGSAVTIRTARDSLFEMRLSSTGDRALGVVADGRLAWAVPLDGATPSGGSFVVANAYGAQSQATGAFDGTRHLVAWRARDGIRYRFVGVDGSPAMEPPGTFAGAGTLPRVAALDAAFALVWHRPDEADTVECTPSEACHLVGARVTRDGAPIDSEPFRIFHPGIAGSVQQSAVASNGQSVLAVYATTDGTWATLIGPSGEPGERVTLAGRSRGVAVAPDGSDGFVVALGDDDKVLRSVDASGAPVGEDVPIEGCGLRAIAGLARDPGGWMLLCTRSSSIYAISIDDSLTASEPVEIRTELDAVQASIAFDGSHHVILFGETDAPGPLYAVRVTPAGELVDATPLEVVPEGRRATLVAGAPAGGLLLYDRAEAGLPRVAARTWANDCEGDACGPRPDGGVARDGGGGSSGDGGPGGSGGGSRDDGGCGCTTPGSARVPSPMWAFLALLALGARAARRARSRRADTRV